MTYIARITLGVINIILFASMLFFWNFKHIISPSEFQNRIEVLVYTAFTIVMLISPLLMSIFCFSHKLRRLRKFWTSTFITNSITLLSILASALFARFLTSDDVKAGAIQAAGILAPLGVIYLLNSIFLINKSKDLEEKTLN